MGRAEAMERIAKASPAWNSTLRTTCVATMLEGGHAHNALPQLAAANVNCRVQPDESLDTLLETGVLGVIGWMWLFGRAIRRLGARAKLERDTPDGWLPVAMASSLAGFVASMWFYDAFTFTQGDFLMHLLIGFIAVLLLLPVANRTGAARSAVRP